MKRYVINRDNDPPPVSWYNCWEAKSVQTSPTISCTDFRRLDYNSTCKTCKKQIWRRDLLGHWITIIYNLKANHTVDSFLAVTERWKHIMDSHKTPFPACHQIEGEIISSTNTRTGEKGENMNDWHMSVRNVLYYRYMDSKTPAWGLTRLIEDVTQSDS
jgi:hypothetical protein